MHTITAGLHGAKRGRNISGARPHHLHTTEGRGVRQRASSSEMQMRYPTVQRYPTVEAMGFPEEEEVDVCGTGCDVVMDQWGWTVMILFCLLVSFVCLYGGWFYHTDPTSDLMREMAVSKYEKAVGAWTKDKQDTFAELKTLKLSVDRMLDSDATAVQGMQGIENAVMERRTTELRPLEDPLVVNGVAPLKWRYDNLWYEWKGSLGNFSGGWRNVTAILRIEGHNLNIEEPIVLSYVETFGSSSWKMCHGQFKGQWSLPICRVFRQIIGLQVCLRRKPDHTTGHTSWVASSHVFAYAPEHMIYGARAIDVPARKMVSRHPERPKFVRSCLPGRAYSDVRTVSAMSKDHPPKGAEFKTFSVSILAEDDPVVVAWNVTKGEMQFGLLPEHRHTVAWVLFVLSGVMGILAVLGIWCLTMEVQEQVKPLRKRAEAAAQRSVKSSLLKNKGLAFPANPHHAPRSGQQQPTEESNDNDDDAYHRHSDVIPLLPEARMVQLSPLRGPALDTPRTGDSLRSPALVGFDAEQ